jgi:hypothetical protein
MFRHRVYLYFLWHLGNIRIVWLWGTHRFCGTGNTYTDCVNNGKFTNVLAEVILTERLAKGNTYRLCCSGETESVFGTGDNYSLFVTGNICKMLGTKHTDRPFSKMWIHIHRLSRNKDRLSLTERWQQRDSDSLFGTVHTCSLFDNKKYGKTVWHRCYLSQVLLGECMAEGIF